MISLLNSTKYVKKNSHQFFSTSCKIQKRWGHFTLIWQGQHCCWQCSVAKLCLTLCDPLGCSTPGFLVFPCPYWGLVRLMSIESVMLCNHLILCCPLLLLPSIFPRGLFQWVGSSHQVAKVLELQLQHQFFQRIFRVDFLWDGLVWSPCSPRTLESSLAPQFESINSLALSLLYGPALTSIHDYLEKP